MDMGHLVWAGPGLEQGKRTRWKGLRRTAANLYRLRGDYTLRCAPFNQTPESRGAEDADRERRNRHGRTGAPGVGGAGRARGPARDQPVQLHRPPNTLGGAPEAPT